MENRAHALAAGLFTLILGAALVAVTVWFSKDDLKLVPYTLFTTGSVTGLNAVCATGDIDVSAAISVTSLCSNGNVMLRGAADLVSIGGMRGVRLQGRIGCECSLLCAQPRSAHEPAAARRLSRFKSAIRRWPARSSTPAAWRQVAR